MRPFGCLWFLYPRAGKLVTVSKFSSFHLRIEFAMFYLLLLFLHLPTFTTPTPPQQRHFYVTFSTQTLGLQLSKDLVVTGFASSCSTITRELVRAGDTILTVNQQPVTQLSTKEALTIIRDAQLPKILEFVSHHAQASVQLPSLSDEDGSNGVKRKAPRVRLLDIDLGLVGTISMVRAEFGTWGGGSGGSGGSGSSAGATSELPGEPTSTLTGSGGLCVPHLVEFASPIKACTALTSSSSSVKGKIAVVERGSCSFLAKAWQVFLHGAVGCIVINKEESVVTMPSESDDASIGLNIPVVMVKKSAWIMLTTAQKNGTHVQLYDPNLCGKNIELL